LHSNYAGDPFMKQQGAKAQLRDDNSEYLLHRRRNLFI